MSVLGALATADLAPMFADWADAVTFTAPTGTPPATVTPASGVIVDRISMATDLMTGAKVAGKQHSLAVLAAELGAVAAGWKATVGGADYYVDGDPMIDHSLGLAVLMVRS